MMLHASPLLNLVCSVPGLIEQVIKPPMGGAGLTIYIQLYNSIFFFVFASVLYAVVRHSIPRLPLNRLDNTLLFPSCYLRDGFILCSTCTLRCPLTHSCARPEHLVAICESVAERQNVCTRASMQGSFDAHCDSEGLCGF